MYVNKNEFCKPSKFTVIKDRIKCAFKCLFGKQFVLIYNIINSNDGSIMNFTIHYRTHNLLERDKELLSYAARLTDSLIIERDRIFEQCCEYLKPLGIYTVYRVKSGEIIDYQFSTPKAMVNFPPPNKNEKITNYCKRIKSIR